MTMQDLLYVVAHVANQEKDQGDYSFLAKTLTGAC